MAAIDIGYGANTLPGSGLPTGWTLIDQTNPANDTGALAVFEIYTPTNFTGVKMGTFSGSGTTYTYRDHELIGNVTGGSKQTFSGLNCEVVTGDFIAVLAGGGEPRFSASGGSGVAYYGGDVFSAGSHTFTFNANLWMPLYGTGVTPGVFLAGAIAAQSGVAGVLKGGVHISGWKSPGTVINADRDGKAAWSYPEGAVSSNNLYAYAKPSESGDYTDWLRCTNFGFTEADIPAGLIITDVEIEIEHYSNSAAGAKDSSLKLRKTSGQVGSDKASASYWPTSDAYAAYLWGGSAGLVPSDVVDNSDFGVDLSILTDGIDVFGYVDHVRIRIYSTDSVTLLAGTIDAQSALTGALAVAWKLAGAIAAQAGAAGALKVAWALAGSSSSQAAIEGALKRSRTITGTAAGQALVAGFLGVIKEIAGAVAAQTTVGGSLSKDGMIGGLAAQTTAEGVLEAQKKMMGAVAAQAIVQAQLARVIQIAGDIAAQSSLGGEVTPEDWISGIIAAVSTVQGALVIGKALAGEVAAQAVAEAYLTTPGGGQRQSQMFLVI